MIQQLPKILYKSKKLVFLLIILIPGSLNIVNGQAFVKGQQLEYKTRAIGNSWIGPVGQHMQNHITNITVFADGTVRTQSPWDEGGNRCAEYKDGKFVRKATCDANSKRAVDLNGNIWTIENYYGRFLDINANHGGNETTNRWRIDPIPTGNDAPYVKSSDGREIRLVGDPSAIGINKVTGELLVADNTEAQNIKIFDISAEPQLVGTFGVEGGIYSGPNPGAKDDPLKFNGITGVGTDAEGNIYVACDGFPGSQSEGGGADLRAFNPDGSLRWRMVGLMFVRAASVDPASGGSDIYCPFTLYRVDYSKEPGNDMADWTDVALTINPFKYPDDPRLVGGVNTAMAIVNINGNKYMFSTDMYNEPFFVHRFDGYIAVPVAVITAGYGWNGDEWIKFRWKHNRGRPATPRWMWVDKNGDGLAQAEEFELFELGGPADRNFVRGIDIDRDGNIIFSNEFGFWKLPTNGFDENGTPRYSAASIQKIEGSGYGPRAIKYLDELDIMVAGQGSHSHMSQVHVYENWSDPEKRTLRFSINTPAPASSGGAFNIAADEGYFYVSYSVESGPNTGYRGEVLVYNLKDGAYMGYITPGPEVGGYSGWIDMRQATFSYVRPNGERLITVEEDGVGKVLIYEWCPPGEICEGECTQQLDSLSFTPSEMTIEGLQEVALQLNFHPENICFDRILWQSMDESIASVDRDGVVTTHGVGNTEIKATSEMQFNVSAIISISVGDVPVTGIAFEKDSITIPTGITEMLNVVFLPANAVNRNLLWESSNPDIVAVNQQGEIIGFKPGVAFVIVETVDGGFTDTCYVEITSEPVTGIRFIPEYLAIWMDNPAKTHVEILPHNASNQTILWEIEDESILEIDTQDIVTGLTPGKTLVTATTEDGGYTASVLIHIVAAGQLGNMDIGEPCGAGGHIFENGIHTVRGNGVEIGGNADELHFAYQKHSGNTLVLARLLSISNTGHFAKAGVMIRENLDAGSKHAMMAVTRGAGSYLGWRRDTDGIIRSVLPGDGRRAPAWIKIIREGNTFSGYVSDNGIDWILVNNIEIDMADEVYVGLSVNAHNTICLVNTSQFDNLIISDKLDSLPDIKIPSNDSTLSDLTIDGTTVEGFDPLVLSYSITLPAGTTGVPKVEGTPNHEEANVVVSQASDLSQEATLQVTAEDGVSESVYRVSFSVETSIINIDNGSLTLYPNPVSNSVNLMLEASGEKLVDINIYDISGRLKISKQSKFLPGKHSIDIDVSKLGEGMYILGIGNELKTKIKFLIQR